MNTDKIGRSAIISQCKNYRYTLSRELLDVQSNKVLAIIMLNPSIADTNIDDPTIRRCISFARKFGCRHLTVVNLFAYRATSPKNLAKAQDPFGPSNASYIQRLLATDSATFVCAWGANKMINHNGAASKMVKAFESAQVTPYCLGKTKNGHPKHPLYLPSNSNLEVLC